VLSVRKNSPVIWRPLGVRTVPEDATLSAIEWFHSPTIIEKDLLIIIIIIIIGPFGEEVINDYLTILYLFELSGPLLRLK
jgi:hypothetical protein